MSVATTVSYNLDQPGRVDRNLQSTPSFIVPGEGRAVFAAASSIVSSGGGSPMTPSRIDATLGPVVVNTSDLRTLTSQVSLAVARYHQDEESFGFRTRSPRHG